MLTQSFSESFYNILLNTLRDNANDSSLPQEDIEKANKLIYLLARKAVNIKDENGDVEMQITWYERTCCDLAMQAMYALKREYEQRESLNDELKELRAKVSDLKPKESS
jgi:hypothetical protein